ncbi:hypothetical protein Dda3937_04491 [Dickeya dadantii 3937]|uniref:Uncharacterized protein n=1 Tax=Dickeya dadantii (strain 3937) TaxID=198628 RepID=E0SD73_DICD3|nr:hypothetical protein Dda3937_04491 [Dickeya dadantii 3937]
MMGRVRYKAHHGMMCLFLQVIKITVIRQILECALAECGYSNSREAWLRPAQGKCYPFYSGVLSHYDGQFTRGR